MSKLHRSLLFLLIPLCLAGCGKLELVITDLPGTGRFEVKEGITLLDMTQHHLGIGVVAGPTDFWQRLAEICKMNNWTLKTRSANRLAVTATFADSETDQVSKMLSKQLAWTADGYGAKVNKNATDLLPIKIKIDKKGDLLSTVYTATCDYDLNINKLTERLAPPEEWIGFMNMTSTIPIIVKLQLPMEVINTNGTYDPSTHTCTWQVLMGSTGQATITCRSYNWTVIGSLAGAGVLILGALTFLFIRRSKTSPVKEKPES